MPQPFQYDQIQEFISSLVPERPAEMQAMERYADENNFPIIGPACGYYCYQLARMTRALSIFEMGSGYGYSTAWFAKAVRETSREMHNAPGQVRHVVWDESLSQLAREHLKNLGLDQYVSYHVAEAVNTLQEMQENFDLIFCDIDKDAYPAALKVIEKKLRPGGLLIIDNMLWHGRIFDSNDQSATTNGVREFTQQICSSPDWIVSLAPLRDGLIVAQKTSHGWFPNN
jgi:predicted O-methyltransferase YrrM